MAVYFIGIDPAQKVSGLALEYDGHRFAGTCGDILAAEAFLDSLPPLPPGGAAFLAIEYPTFNVKASPVVRAAANAWVRAIKARAKAARCSLQVVKVHPSTWRAKMVRGNWSQAKAVAMPVARAYKFEPDSVDAAEAALILVYGRDWVHALESKMKILKKKR